jgi:type III pantothenate kinase
MKNACIDFGNTRIKIGIFDDETLNETLSVLTLDEVMGILEWHAVENIMISSVTFSYSQIKEILPSEQKVIFLDASTPLPILNNYQTPATLGYDRIAAAIGANWRFADQNCLILDIGTAIKYDFISKQNTFEGGLISPGRRMRFEALHTFTKKLPLLDTVAVPELIGRSTEQCMASGVLNGIVAEINGIIEKYTQKHDLKILICGGDAPYFESQINYPTFAAPNLVIEGLNRILYHNVKNI